VGWGLVIAASWPIVWLRELDFAPSVVSVAEVANNGVEISPDIALLWVYGVVAFHGFGLLLLDWLFATFGRGDGERFQRAVLMPLALGWGGAWLVGLYQAEVDPAFLNRGHWAMLRRASGTLMDANPFGMVAALWGAIGVALILGRRLTWRSRRWCSSRRGTGCGSPARGRPWEPVAWSWSSRCDSSKDWPRTCRGGAWPASAVRACCLSG